jgi:hypothetical protein
LKRKITEQPMLVLPDFQKTFQVKCDASGYAVGGVLSQDDRPVAYFSEKLDDAKLKYSTYDKEFYAIIQALKKWRHYLIPKEFVLYSDNHALQFVSQQEKLNQKHAKWVEYMQNFTFVIKHISGTANKVADALSRKCLLLQEFRVKTLGFENLKDMYAGDADFREAYEAAENPVLRDRSPWIDYLIQDGLLFKGNQLCIPDCSMRENLVKEKHSGGLAGHFGHDKTFAKLSESYYWPGMRADVKGLLTDAGYVNMRRAESRTQGSISHCLYPRGHGRPLVWILFWDCRERREELIPFLWWWTGSRRWHISYRVIRPAMRPTSRIYFSKKSSDCMDCREA